jgi:hypothetical protein
MSFRFRAGELVLPVVLGDPPAFFVADFRFVRFFAMFPMVSGPPTGLPQKAMLVGWPGQPAGTSG